MSGPKSVSLSVNQARADAKAAKEEVARRERAERRRLQRRAKTLSSQVNRLAQQWQKASRESGGAFKEWSHQDILRDLAECQRDYRRRNKQLTAALDRLAERITQARTEYALQSSISRMRASFQAAVEAQAADQRAAVRSAQEKEAQRSERAMRRFAEQVSGALETLDPEVPTEARAAIEAKGEETIAASGAFRRSALLAQLRLDIRHANEAAAERRRTVEQVEEWRERLMGLEGQAVDDLDNRLQRVVEGDAPPADLEDQVDRVAGEAREASNREYALTVIMEELENLGYVVESGFETASAQQPEALLRKPGMEDGYHVSLRAEGSLLHNRVVRETTSSGPAGDGTRSADRARSDRQAEQTWCGDLASALAACGAKGVHGRVVSRKKVGEVPVKAIAALTHKIKAKKKRRRKRTGRLRSRVGR